MDCLEEAAALVAKGSTDDDEEEDNVAKGSSEEICENGSKLIVPKQLAQQFVMNLAQVLQCPLI